MIAPLSYHWHILGAGAIGCLLASQLHRAGEKVTLLCRDKNTAGDIGTHFSLHENNEKIRVPLDCRAAQESEEISALLICTKAHNCSEAFASVSASLSSRAPVVLLHNGLGVYEEVLKQYPEEDLFCGTTTEAAFFQQDGSLVHAGSGKINIGRPKTSTAPDWFSNFSQALSHAHWEQDIERSLWRKLLVNAVINPLTTLYDCNNGQILQREDCQTHGQQLSMELAQICRARGYPDLADNVWIDAQAVAASTANNHSSMRQDLAHGRRSEIDNINGYLSGVARSLGISCPVNDDLWREIRRLEDQR